MANIRIGDGINLESLKNKIPEDEILDKFILSRYYYRNGYSLIDDKEYNLIHETILDIIPDFEYLHRLYEDDPIPTDLLAKYDIPIIDEGITIRSAEGENRSIRGCEDQEKVIEFLKRYKGRELIFSCKIDGISSNNLYSKGEFKRSTSRGRSGNKKDYTLGTKYVLPSEISIKDDINVRAECFCDDINYLSKRYGKNYVSMGSAALSAVHGDFLAEDYKNHFYAIVFNFGYGKTISEGLAIAREEGFITVPHMITTVPEDFDDEDLLDWIKCIIDQFYDINLPQDGLVVSLNNIEELEKEGGNGVYLNGQMAIRIYKFSSDVYEGEVEELIFTTNRVRTSVKARIKTKVINGKKYNLVNTFNPDITIKANARKGQKILFEIKANGSVELSKECYNIRDII